MYFEMSFCMPGNLVYRGICCIFAVDLEIQREGGKE